MYNVDELIMQIFRPSNGTWHTCLESKDFTLFGETSSYNAVFKYFGEGLLFSFLGRFFRRASVSVVMHANTAANNKS